MSGVMKAGGAAVDLTPGRPMFLYGYPHVPRMSTGVLDPLLASALYLHDGVRGVMFIGCDLIWVPRAVIGRAQARLASSTGVDAEAVMVSATHTHSGPVVNAMLSNAADPVVPPPDDAYLAQVEDAIVAAGEQAHRAAKPATLKFAVADGSMLGTNRHDPSGPGLPRVPVLWCEDAATGEAMAVMAVCTMHPTVLHEDSTQISGDFPGQARQYLQRHVVGSDCPFVYHMGPAGNQSPRHVVKANTVEETRRLGEALGRSIVEAMKDAQVLRDAALTVKRAQVELPVRELPTVDAAAAALKAANERFESLRRDGAPRAAVRTAECDCFGAQETLTLAEASSRGELAKAAAACTPAVVQVIGVGRHTFVGWPGEVFVEFALRVRERFPDAWIISLAGGDLQGYLVTREAVEAKVYESGNAVFASPASGDLLVEATMKLLSERA